MKFFVFFFAACLVLFAWFWYNDAAGSGMVYPTVVFALLLAGTLIYNKVRNGGWLKEGPSLNDKADRK